METQNLPGSAVPELVVNWSTISLNIYGTWIFIILDPASRDRDATTRSLVPVKVHGSFGQMWENKVRRISFERSASSFSFVEEVWSADIGANLCLRKTGANRWLCENVKRAARMAGKTFKPMKVIAISLPMLPQLKIFFLQRRWWGPITEVGDVRDYDQARQKIKNKRRRKIVAQFFIMGKHCLKHFVWNNENYGGQ